MNALAALRSTVRLRCLSALLRSIAVCLAAFAALFAPGTDEFCLYLMLLPRLEVRPPASLPARRRVCQDRTAALRG
jgi:hypothetical protein